MASLLQILMMLKSQPKQQQKTWQHPLKFLEIGLMQSLTTAINECGKDNDDVDERNDDRVVHDTTVSVIVSTAEFHNMH